MSQLRTNRTGFQGSETTGVKVTIYPHTDNRPPTVENLRSLLRGESTIIEFNGGNPEASGNPTVISVSTTKAIGPAAGNFTIVVKVPEDRNLFNEIMDDDWIDISFFTHEIETHIMRGLVSGVREATKAGGEGGATSRTFTITGNDFGIIFEKTPIWFNKFAAENVASQLTIGIFQGINVGGQPNETVSKILYGFIETLTGLGRVNWEPPPALAGSAQSFAERIKFNDNKFSGEPERRSISTQFMDPGGISVWSFAQEWSDPIFCELFCDLGDANVEGGELDVDSENAQTPDDTRMTVFFRDRPFPFAPPFGSNTTVSQKTEWFKLQTADISPYEIQSKDIGRSGESRVNAFFLSPQVLQSIGSRVDTQAPLWNADDINRHGLRKFEIQSRYLAKKNSLFTMSESQRRIARDWHCINAELFNGNLSLARLRPKIRVGMRARIRGDDETSQETYYVEQVQHNWSLPTGGRTTLGVTRGFIGTDQDLADRISLEAEQYRIALGKGKFKGNPYGGVDKDGGSAS